MVSVKMVQAAVVTHLKQQKQMHSSATLMPTMRAQPDGVSNAAEEPLFAMSAVAGTAPAATSGFPMPACVTACIPQYTGANTS
jgi:hypothetical protein